MEKRHVINLIGGALTSVGLVVLGLSIWAPALLTPGGWVSSTKLPAELNTPLLGAELGTYERKYVISSQANENISGILHRGISWDCSWAVDKCTDKELLFAQSELGRIGQWATTLSSQEMREGYDAAIDIWQKPFLTAMARRELIQTIPKPPE